MESLLKELLALKKKLRYELGRSEKKKKNKKIVRDWIEEEAKTTEDYEDLEMDDIIEKINKQNISS